MITCLSKKFGLIFFLSNVTLGFSLDSLDTVSGYSMISKDNFAQLAMLYCILFWNFNRACKADF